MNKEQILVIVKLLAVLTLTFGLSFLVTRHVGTPQEKKISVGQISVKPEMTIIEAAHSNGIKTESIYRALNLTDTAGTNNTFKDLGITKESAESKIQKRLNYEAEESSKNFFMIKIKFSLWLLFMLAAFFMLKKRLITPPVRKKMLFLSFAVFGIILGTEPNPMSMLKDIITNFAFKGIIFPPRILALTLFLIIVFLANKFVCAWACQFGTLQDFIFRLNRNPQDNKGIISQYKIPFVISNTVRVLFFASFIFITFLWATDIIEHLNPFAIFKPAFLSLGAIFFILLILTMSLFIYRPWCHFFCPFGLFGWMLEKVSLYKIKVNYATCIACEECAKACPSTVMAAILKQDKTIPDCFSCGTCITVCPTQSITFDKGAKGTLK